MRTIQVGLFVIGIAALVVSAGFVCSVVGDALWRAGVAVFLVDIVSIMLWPQPSR